MSSRERRNGPDQVHTAHVPSVCASHGIRRAADRLGRDPVAEPLMAVGRGVAEVAPFTHPGALARVRQWWEQEQVFGYGLILPAFALIAALVAFPFCMAIYFSLSDYWVGSPGSFVGLANYREILGNEVFRQTVQNSFVFTGIALTLKTVLGVWLAVLLARDVRFKRLIRGAVLLPFVIPTALSTLGWWWMFDSLYSVVNWTGIRLGILTPPGPNWLGQSAYAMAAVIIVNVWRGLPFFAVTTLAWLVAIPREFYAAAERGGADPSRSLYPVAVQVVRP